MEVNSVGSPLHDVLFADLLWAGLSTQMLMRSTKISATTKLSAGHETSPIVNVLL